jgi:hypothetical protein
MLNVERGTTDEERSIRTGKISTHCSGSVGQTQHDELLPREICKHMSDRPELGHPSGVHLGGIGAGRIELCRDGSFGIVNLVHSPQRLLSGFDGTFLALRAGSTFRLLQRNGR